MNPENIVELERQLKALKREGEERVARRLGEQLGFPYVDLSKVPASTEAVKLLKEEDARNARVCPIELRTRQVALAAENPTTPEAQKLIRYLEEQKYEVKTFVASRSSLEQVWGLYKFVRPPVETITGRVHLEEKKVEELLGRLGDFPSIQKELADADFVKTPPILLIEVILAGAIANRASDVHFEAGEKKVKLRFRVDGLLHEIANNVPLSNYGAILSRIKLISNLKINVKDVAQDGRFSITLGKKDIEIRVSIIPSEFGETLVMRILDPETTSIGLAGLGIREDDLEVITRELAKPNGLILNTGPTGSGKTTTLYSFLRHINDPQTKIITLEDPIEYRLEGVEQTQVDPAAGYTFAGGLRSIVRQDPDVILVGEIRDVDTADIALQAALTGHLVLSTLHTNDAVGAIPRLINLGVKPVSIGPGLNLIIAQRLVRKLCPYCRKRAELTAGQKSNISRFLEALPQRVDRSHYETFEVYESGSCAKCNNLGYKGRTGVFEFFEGATELEEIILKDASEVALLKLAEKQGMISMQKDGILKVLKGITSFKEVESATGQIEW